MNKVNGSAKLSCHQTAYSSANIDAGEKSSGTRIFSILNPDGLTRDWDCGSSIGGMFNRWKLFVEAAF